MRYSCVRNMITPLYHKTYRNNARHSAEISIWHNRDHLYNIARSVVKLNAATSVTIVNDIINNVTRQRQQARA